MVRKLRVVLTSTSMDDLPKKIRELLVLSLQETLCGCRPEVLGNLRNEMFLYFVKVDQWDNSIHLIAFRHQMVNK